MVANGHGGSSLLGRAAAVVQTLRGARERDTPGGNIPLRGMQTAQLDLIRCPHSYKRGYRVHFLLCNRLWTKENSLKYLYIPIQQNQMDIYRYLFA